VDNPAVIPTELKSAKTFAQFVRAAAKAYGDDPAIAYRSEGVPDETLSFVDIERRSAELARGLLGRGVGKGSRVGFICGNNPTFAVWLAAVARIGAIAIPISTLIKSNELVRVLRQSDVSGLIVQRTLLGHDYVERICVALPDLKEGADPDLRLSRTPFLRWIASTGEGLPPTVRDMSWIAEGAARVDEAFLAEVESEVHPADQMVEIYTSGSMALPKGVKHNHGPVMFRTGSVRSKINISRGMEAFVSLPMFWVGGLMMSLLPNWQVGATTICTDHTLKNSRMAMGSVLAEEDLKLLAKQDTYWGLGMTETIGPYSWGDDFRAPGYPVCAPMDHWADGFEVRIYDEEKGEVVGDGGIGEVQVRGYPLTPGLHKIERAEHFTPDGFYHTGDMGLVEGTRVHFVGRNGDMIKTASANVSPAEVEMEMQSLEGVHNAYVVGLPDQERGQLVVAAVVPREGVKLDFTAIEGELRKRLSSYKVPRAYVELSREEVPLLHSNKVARRQIEKMMAERLGRT
jgi:acyl-CoA synthetase (AMP-forming)/AMP-acid ligase II